MGAMGQSAEKMAAEEDDWKMEAKVTIDKSRWVMKIPIGKKRANKNCQIS